MAGLKKFPLPTMRLAAEWLERPNEWSNPAAGADNVACPLCTRVIPGKAIICPECGHQIKEMPAELAKLNLGRVQQGQTLRQ